MLLGASLLPEKALFSALDTCVANLETALDRLQLTARQDVLLLLRCLPKLMYLLRCAPCYNQLHLIDYDKPLRGGMERILNISLPEDQWMQASLPIKMGGLGVRRVSSLALPAFWLRLRAPSPSSLSSWDQPEMLRTHPLIAHKQTGSESQGLRIRQPAPVTSSHCGTSRFC